MLAAAADQIGGSLERDRLQREATSAEISRRSDALKSALLDSVSHDLRTPLASIRAAAGTLMDPDVEWPADQRREIAGIDRPRGRVAEPARHEPPRHEPGRGGRTAAEPGGLRARRPRRRGRAPVRSQPRGPRRRGPDPAGPAARHWSTRSSSARSSRTPSTTPRSTAGPTRRSGVRARRRPTGDGRLTSRTAARASRPRPCRGCSRSSIACRARARDPGAGPASASPSCAASSRPWAGPSRRGPSELGGLAIELDLPIAADRPSNLRRPMTSATRGCRAAMIRPHEAASILLVEDDDADTQRRSRRSSAGTGTRSRRPATRPRPRQAWESAAARPDRPGPRAARPRRPGASSGTSDARRRRRSSSCRPAIARPTRWPRWISAPTTTSPSRSA